MKGFGSILAEVAIAKRAEAFAGAPACPICGAPMEGGVAWFCYSDREAHKDWLNARAAAAYEYQRSGGVVFYADLKTAPEYRYENWNPALIGVIMAAAVTPDGETLLFSTVRGSSGINFRVDMPKKSAYIPQPNDWHWAEWTK